jgi:hypothetical protein
MVDIYIDEKPSNDNLPKYCPYCRTQHVMQKCKYCGEVYCYKHASNYRKGNMTFCSLACTARYEEEHK